MFLAMRIEINPYRAPDPASGDHKSCTCLKIFHVFRSNSICLPCMLPAGSGSFHVASVCSNIDMIGNMSANIAHE